MGQTRPNSQRGRYLSGRKYHPIYCSLLSRLVFWPTAQRSTWQKWATVDPSDIGLEILSESSRVIFAESRFWNKSRFLNKPRILIKKEDSKNSCLSSFNLSSSLGSPSINLQFLPHVEVHHLCQLILDVKPLKLPPFGWLRHAKPPKNETYIYSLHRLMFFWVCHQCLSKCKGLELRLQLASGALLFVTRQRCFLLAAAKLTSSQLYCLAKPFSASKKKPSIPQTSESYANIFLVNQTH